MSFLTAPLCSQKSNAGVAQGKFRKIIGRAPTSYALTDIVVLAEGIAFGLPCKTVICRFASNGNNAIPVADPWRGQTACRHDVPARLGCDRAGQLLGCVTVGDNQRQGAALRLVAAPETVPHKSALRGKEERAETRKRVGLSGRFKCFLRRLCARRDSDPVFPRLRRRGGRAFFLFPLRRCRF